MDKVQDVEDALLNGATDSAVYMDVVNLRRELGPFERSLLYSSDFAAILIHEKPEVLSPAVLSYFAEVLSNETDKLEKEFSILRDRTSELIQIYRDNINTQLNNLMRVIAVISTIFLPLSFITGFYGMNFPNMPALKWSGSFPIVVAIMILLVIGGLIYAKKKKWL
jgi:magnesium transporter